MFQLDNNFLKDIGLENMPDEQKKPFLQHIYSELELRVGTQLSDGMSDAQLDEFEKIIDHNDNEISGWLAKNSPNYHEDKIFNDLQSKTGLDVNSPELRSEYAATKWLEINRPDYRKVVENVLNNIKQEIIDNKDKILG